MQLFGEYRYMRGGYRFFAMPCFCVEAVPYKEAPAQALVANDVIWNFFQAHSRH